MDSGWRSRLAAFWRRRQHWYLPKGLVLVVGLEVREEGLVRGPDRAGVLPDQVWRLGRDITLLLPLSAISGIQQRTRGTMSVTRRATQEKRVSLIAVRQTALQGWEGVRVHYRVPLARVLLESRLRVPLDRP
jgi:hypothetical protein